MTLIAQPTTFTAEQAETQLREWFAAGRPEGEISFPSKTPGLINLWVPTKADVNTWASHMATPARMCIETFATGRQTIFGLPGWRIDVWCFADEVIKPDLELNRWLDSVAVS